MPQCAMAHCGSLAAIDWKASAAAGVSERMEESDGAIELWLEILRAGGGEGDGAELFGRGMIVRLLGEEK